MDAPTYKILKFNKKSETWSVAGHMTQKRSAIERVKQYSNANKNLAFKIIEEKTIGLFSNGKKVSRI